ncbi:MAG: toll/interleukin-1 receptor domain-containing protein [Flavobacteriales bacterium]|nr:MAG: toll/interleukin-1 receptor domain-containing protein [Flavobacteriales bacterium]
MALIPDFENDIFISYVHDDNVPETANEEGWVNQFYKYLEVKLKRHHKDIKIWWDEKHLDKSQVFDKTIAEAIDKSAIMICLYSRRYTQSEYCIKELEHFHKKVQAEKTGLLVGDRSRIIPVMLSNIPYSEWPEKLSGTTSFKFHDASDNEIYGDPLHVKSEGAFSDEMKKLRTSLVQIFEDFTKANAVTTKPQQAIAQKADTETFTIYIGEVSDSLYDRRDGIIAELEGSGYDVITGDPSTADAETHEKATLEAIEKVQLAVHILNGVPGRKINGDPNSRYIQKQVEIGLATSTPQLIWVPAELDFDAILNKEHQAFLKGLEERSLSDKNYEYVRGNEGELSKILQGHSKQLEDALVKERSLQKTQGKTALKVLLDTHIDDFKDAFNLKKTLSDHNIELIFNPEDGDPQENIKSLFNNINEAEKFIFLYGSETNKDWVDIRVKNTMKKLMEYDRFKQDIFVYMTPPFKDDSDIKVAQSPLVKVINNSGKTTIDAESLNAFLKELIADNQ